jgi:hypothetical protein
LQQLDSVAEWIGGKRSIESGQAFAVVFDFMAAGSQRGDQFGKITDQQSGVRFLRRREISVDSKVQLKRAALKPDASARCEPRGFRYFGQAKQYAVKLSRLRFSASRHRQLNVVKTVNALFDHRLRITTALRSAW